MKTLYAIGEALIDFIPLESGRALKEVSGFSPAVGGAPANVCGAYTRLGGQSSIITQLGADPFGDKIYEEFQHYNIGCDHVLRTEQANTSLAFVALQEDGNREFSFYRKPGADMLFDSKQVKKEWFKDAYALHFCSVSIGDFPMRDAHVAAIDYATAAGALISFDPNLRFALWESENDLRKAVLTFIPKAHILKISDEELEFITGKKTIEEATDQLFVGNVSLVIYTTGADGAHAYTRETCAHSTGHKVQAKDTTGAGDAFIGSFLYQLSADGIDKRLLPMLSEEQMRKYLDFSNEYCSRSVQKSGAIASYPTMAEMHGKNEIV